MSEKDMSEKDDTVEKLSIPLNCPDSPNIITGFRSEEITVIIISFILCVISAFIIHFVVQDMIMTLIIPGSILAFIIILIRRNQYQESIIDVMVQMIRYHRAQHQYEYHYYNIYEGDVKE